MRIHVFSGRSHSWWFHLFNMPEILEITSLNQTTLLQFQLLYPTISLTSILGCLIDLSYHRDLKNGSSELHPHYSCLWTCLPHWVGLCDLLNPVHAEEVGGTSSSSKPPEGLTSSAFCVLWHHSNSPATVLERLSRDTTWKSPMKREKPPGLRVLDFQPSISKC